MYENWLSAGWKFLLLRGVIAVIFGIVAVIWPISTALALVLLWGIWALADGVGSLIQAFQSGQSTGSRVLLVLMGVIALAAGIIAVTRPISTAVTLTWILGLWLIVRGIFEVFGAFSSTRTGPRWLLLVGAALDLLLGVLFVANPGRSALAIAWVLGLTAIAWGVVFIAMSLWLRKETKSFEATMGSGSAASA